MENLRKTPIIKFLVSYKATLICLCLLLILTVWGTLSQVQSGLFAAKERFFNSWFFLAGGFFPFPGGRLVLWLAFINLFAMNLFRLRYKWSKAGLIVVHWGLLLLLIGAGYTFHFSKESSLTLSEGKGANVSTDYHFWELCFWTEKELGDSLIRAVEAFHTSNLSDGKTFSLSQPALEIEILEFHPHCKGDKNSSDSGGMGIFNAGGLKRLLPLKPHSDPGKNFPGAVLSLQNPATDNQTSRMVLVHGGDFTATPVNIGGHDVYCTIRRMRHILPFTLTLLDFQKKDHPGTNMAKSFESRVTIHTPDLKREVVISMNKPLRYNDFTFYQSSYNRQGNIEMSTLSVVQNSGRLLPYIASIIVSIGMAWHFCAMLLAYSTKHK